MEFYIFDGLKTQNIERGLSLFETFGAPVSEECIRLFRSSKSDEINCVVEFDENSVKSISMKTENREICEDAILKIDNNANSSKWNAFHSLAPSQFISVDLNSDGFYLKKLSVL